MTTRHASLAPIRTLTFQRERRQMQSKHLWDTLCIDWAKLSWKLYTYKPTGLSREHLWTHLFVTKHQEREYQGADQDAVYNRWYQDKRYMGAYKATKTLQGIDIDVSMVGFNIDNSTAKKALQDAKDKHARRWQTKEGTYRRKEQLLPDVRDNGITDYLPIVTLLMMVGMESGTFLGSPGRDAPLLGCRYFLGSWNYVASFGSSTYEGASDVSLFHLFHHPPLHLPVAFSVLLWLFGWGFLFLFGCFVSP